MIKNKTYYYLLFFFIAANIYLVIQLYKSNKNTKVESEPNADAVIQIKQILDRQVMDWNDGDIPAFMNGYVSSDRLIFITSTTTIKGKNNLQEIYLKNFDSPEKRGKLNFLVDEFIPLDNLHQSYLIPGRWEVSRLDTVLQGKFSLIFKKIPEEGWKIIADHTW